MNNFRAYEGKKATLSHWIVLNAQNPPEYRRPQIDESVNLWLTENSEGDVVALRDRIIFRVTVACLVVLCSLALTVQPANAATVTQSTVWTAIGTTNVTPMWGPQIPKIVYDAPSGWYYTSTFDGNGAQYPWLAKLWKSHDGVNWTLARYLGGLVRMPPALILDSGNRLWFTTTCEAGPDQCWTGVPAPSNRYVVRLQFTTRLADGSFNFEVWNDFSTRDAFLGNRTYTGLSIDRDRRMIYQVYSNDSLNYRFFLSRFDTWLNTENVHELSPPGVGDGYLYPRIRPGTTPGEVWLYFNQTHVGALNTSIYGVQLWRSTDYGQSFAQGQRFQVAFCPNPDNDNFCDSSDLVIGPDNRPHILFFKRIAGVSHLYYWEGIPGSVFPPGSPVELGALDNHAQLQLSSSGERIVFADDYPVPAANKNPLLRVLRSPNGTAWTTETFTIANCADVTSPNLMRVESGSFPAPTPNTWSMIVSSSTTGNLPYERLEFVTYQI